MNRPDASLPHDDPPTSLVGHAVGPYLIRERIGAGGMGEVYRAHDTTLDREVAVKVLARAVTHDSELASRLGREARLLAAVNHPNVAIIHGLEDVDGAKALVLELVEGPTLADRLASGALTQAEALNLASQIAAALAAAHEKGIIHRDLKPANIKVRNDGVVKVLDFGLAKAIEPPGASPSAAQSPTITAAMTLSGMILGTPIYMSPEQANGEKVDKRTDIWAFGCVLYEMLTGRQAFVGATFTDILAAVIEHDPDWTRLPAHVPESIRRLLAQCLDKDPRKRRQSAADVRLDLEPWPADAPAAKATSPARGPGPLRWLWPVGLIGLTAAVVTATLTYVGDPPPSPEMRVHIVTTPTPFPADFALSPDGRSIAFVASGPSPDATLRLHVRALNRTESQHLPGTEGARYPFWSADGRSLGFFAAERLHRIAVAGGPVQTLAPAPNANGGTWNADGTILFSPTSVSALFTVKDTGGDVTPATSLDVPRQLAHARPVFLPDGRQFVFQTLGDKDAAGVYLGSLDGGGITRLTAADGGAVYLRPDHLVFRQQGSIVAHRLDPVGKALVGDPITIAAATGDDTVSSQAGLSASNSIIAARSVGGARQRTTWFSHVGHILDRGQDMQAPMLSPDDRFVAFDRTVNGNRDVWVFDSVRGGLNRFTVHASVDGLPVWSPDGGRIAFESNRNGTFDLWIKPANGAVEEQPLFAGPDHEWPLHWSRDGRFLLYQDSNLKTKSDLWALPMTGGDRTPVLVANTPFTERLAEFSPDGRWVAYETDESGRSEVVVQAFPTAAGKVQVSTQGGAAPHWRDDGREIYYVAPDGSLTGVPVTTTATAVTPGTPVALFHVPIAGQAFRPQYTVARDGRFLVNGLSADEGTTAPITLILNWRP